MKKLDKTQAALADAINDSGLWMAYVDAAPLFGIGGARAMGQANWKNVRTRLAREDGTTNSHENPAKGDHWMADNPDAITVGTAFGYAYGPGVAKPAGLRMTMREGMMLVGLVPADTFLRLRISKQADALQWWLETRPTSTPYWDAVAEQHKRTRALIQSLLPKP